MKAAGDAAGGTQRVFVALWPTIGVRTRLEKVIGDVASNAPHARPITGNGRRSFSMNQPSCGSRFA